MSDKSRRISHVEQAFSPPELADEQGADSTTDTRSAIRRMIQYGQNKMK